MKACQTKLLARLHNQNIYIMFSSRSAMLDAIANADQQIKALKDTVARLREQKKTYTAMKTDGGRNTAKNIQFDIEQKTRQIKNLQEQKKSFRAQGYRK